MSDRIIRKVDLHNASIGLMPSGYPILAVTRRCSHSNAVPVESGGETVAALCPDCDRQLPAEWLTCSHEETVEVPRLGDRPPYDQLCAGCGVTYQPERSH